MLVLDRLHFRPARYDVPGEPTASLAAGFIRRSSAVPAQNRASANPARPIVGDGLVRYTVDGHVPNLSLHDVLPLSVGRIADLQVVVSGV